MGSANILKLRVLPNLTLQNHPEVNGHCSFIYSKRFNVFILSVLAIFLLCLNSVHAAEIIIQNDHVEYAIDSHGKNLRFLDKASGIDYLDKKIPSYAASTKREGKEYFASSVSLQDNLLILNFEKAGVSAEGKNHLWIK